MDLEPGEQLIFEGHPSWRSILGFYIKGLLLIAVVAALVATGTRVVDDEVNSGLVIAIALVGIVLVLVVGWIKRLFTTYTITDVRLHIRRGIIARAEQQTAITRVQNVNTHQSVLQRLLQIGNVDFDTAADEAFDFRFDGVADPREVVEAVHRAQRVGDAATPSARTR
jgi:uncharacterized membrane protein YdbT with pleckstrin-like domain